MPAVEGTVQTYMQALYRRHDKFTDDNLSFATHSVCPSPLLSLLFFSPCVPLFLFSTLLSLLFFSPFERRNRAPGENSVRPFPIGRGTGARLFSSQLTDLVCRTRAIIFCYIFFISCADLLAEQLDRVGRRGTLRVL